MVIEKSSFVATRHNDINEKYRVLEQIGKGGFGKVFKAEDLWRKQLVALKMIEKKYF